MSKLLTCMIEQAARVISCIIDMTNVTFSLSLPASLDEAQGAALKSSQKRKATPTLVEPDAVAAVVSPALEPRAKVDASRVKDLCFGGATDDSDLFELSAEKCEHLVDLVLNETDHTKLNPPTRKRAKIMAETVPPIP